MSHAVRKFGLPALGGEWQSSTQDAGENVRGLELQTEDEKRWGLKNFATPDSGLRPESRVY